MDTPLGLIRVDFLDAARRLAKASAAAEPNIKAIYLFPKPKEGNEIRLIEIDPTTMPSETVTPYYFAADLVGGIPFPSAIALIRPDERKLSPPEGWGTWKEAKLIWPESK